ncbi:unnamed protein product [Lampetra fluviatilis]
MAEGPVARDAIIGLDHEERGRLQAPQAPFPLDSGEESLSACPTALLEAPAPEDAGETLPAEQGASRPLNTLPSAEATLQEAHGHLAELLHAVASLLAEINPTVSPVKEGAAMPLVDGNSTAISQQAGNSAAQPMHSAAILSLAWRAQPAKIEDAPSAPMDIPALRPEPPAAARLTFPERPRMPSPQASSAEDPSKPAYCSP